MGYMSTEYMQQTVSDFCARLTDMQEKLGAFSSSIDAQRAQVFSALSAFEEKSRTMLPEDVADDDVAKALHAAMSDMAATIAA